MKELDETPLYIIVAMTGEGIIGNGGALPWKIPGELKVFKELTVGNTVIMGRNTFESIGRPLPDRNNIVVSATLSSAEGIQIAGNLEEAVNLGRLLKKKMFVIGGAKLYEKALAFADYLYISWIHKPYEGDVIFPRFDKNAWCLEYEEILDEFTLCLYSRLLNVFMEKENYG